MTSRQRNINVLQLLTCPFKPTATIRGAFPCFRSKVMGFGRRKDKASRPWRLSAKLLIASSVATVIGFSAICASVMIDMRRGEEELARQTLENLASGIDSDISRNVELFDLSLRSVANNMVAPEISQVNSPLRQRILFAHPPPPRHL